MYNCTNISFRPEDRITVTTSKNLHDDKVNLALTSTVIGNPAGVLNGDNVMARNEVAILMPLELCQTVIDHLTNVMNEIKAKENVK